MYLRVKKLRKDAVMPSYAKDGDAGLDLVATSVDMSGEPLYWEYGTGLAIEIPQGFVGLLFPRSSISTTSHQLRNSVGVIDSGYRGEIKLRMRPATPHMSGRSNTGAYKGGDKIAQLVIFEIPYLKIVEVDELTESLRDVEGFGSTGK